MILRISSTVSLRVVATITTALLRQQVTGQLTQPGDNPLFRQPVYVVLQQRCSAYAREERTRDPPRHKLLAGEIKRLAR